MATFNTTLDPYAETTILFSMGPLFMSFTRKVYSCFFMARGAGTEDVSMNTSIYIQIHPLILGR